MLLYRRSPYLFYASFVRFLDWNVFFSEAFDHQTLVVAEQVQKKYPFW